MIRICVMFVLLCWASAPLLLAANPDEAYLPIYNRIQEADRLLRSGRETEARERFLQAKSELEELRRAHPNWNPNVVQFRLNFIASKLADLPGDPTGSTAPPLKVAPLVAPQPGPSAEELAALQNRVEQLEAQNEHLQARLREALAARPTAVEPEELLLAEERIREQQREIELLRLNLDKVQQATATKRSADPALAAAQQALNEARLELSDHAERMASMTLERDALQTRLLATVTELEELRRQRVTPPVSAGTPSVAVRSEVTSAEAEQLKRQMQALHQQLAEERSRNTMLAAERALIETRLDELTALSADPSVQRIRSLEKELATARDITRADSATISALQTALAVARQEQSRVEDELRKQRLEASTGRARLSEAVASTPRPPMADLDQQLTDLQSRLAILEARRTPYAPEELALFRVPAIGRMNGSNQPGQSRSGPSAGAVTLIAEAEKAARAGQFAEAEKRYQEALRLDQQNVDVLARLAAMQIEQDRWEAARKTLDRALALNPRDASSLYHMGRVYYQEGRLDEALSVLSRAAHLDSSKPQIFDFLGITLGRMGLRDPAETALRRAVQLAPGNGSAHHNLAVIYSLQEPPAIELARWHYQRALAAGYPRNPALETQFDGGSR